MWDVDNAYVGAGISGGLARIYIISSRICVRIRMVGEARSAEEESFGDARFTWAIGSALFANSIAFFGIVYLIKASLHGTLCL